ncbi:hypothetical protein P389DRAFT_209814 [Cystobasidium minutum MCA 4210]|uniref:uncharacterized protein n=1 Tax=Cystobasidium minutum MCA 4210 TaxID=1397322 RepID=UPI0034CFC2C5|eukprot:jgi/Rhomi1/209814/estExt_Genemark1.C_3_t10468
MLQLLARRLRGIQAGPSASTTCARCRRTAVTADNYALIHTSSRLQWRTREERRQALHAKDDEFASSSNLRRRSGGRSAYNAREEDDHDGRRHHATPSYPRRRSSANTASTPYRTRDHERRPREIERPPREEWPTPNPYKKQLRRDRQSLAVSNNEAAKGPQYPAHLQRDKQKFPPGTTNEERLRVESRDKINTAFNLAKELPPLTDEDYREVYEELLTYDPAPPSPTQTRLALASSSASPPLLGQASKSAEDRISELLTRLNKRVPEGEVPLTPLPGKEEGGSLAAKLLRLRVEETSTTSDTGSSPTTTTLSGILDRTPSEEAQDEQPASQAQGDPSVGESDLQAAFRDSGVVTTSTRPQSSLSRQHARQRGKIFYALNQLLRPTPGFKPEPRTLIVGEQPAEGPKKIDLATKQEWAALILEASSDRNLTDVLTTFELMKRAGVAVPEDLLAASIRLLSKDQKLIPILLRYFEQNEVRIPPSAHHEVVVGLLENSPASTPTTRAERYLRALEQSHTPALSKTYAAVISHIFHSRSRSGIRSRAWNLYGHMRLVAHPIPSVEVFDAMIYGCSLDDRASPERALDLFTEMTELGVKPSYNTYLGLIRSCARDQDKNSPFYFEALRLLKELLERGFQPERDIFNCILEGARSRGDIGRAKWIVANMLQIASRYPDPRENPLAPDSRTINSLFLTAATYRPPNPRKKDIRLSETDVDTPQQDDVSPGANKHENDKLHREEYETQESTTTERDVRAGQATGQTSSSPDQTAQDAPRQTPHDIYMASETGFESEQDFPPVLHPLYRPDIPHSPHQLLDDFKQIMGTLLEVHDKPTDILEAITTTTSSTTQADLEAGTNIQSRQHRTQYSGGLDEGTKEALRNVPINNVLLNAYMTLLNAHGRSSLALQFFKRAFPELRVRYTHQSWEIIFEALDSSSRQRTKEERVKARNSKASHSREVFELWEGWLKDVLINEERGRNARHGNNGRNDTKTWFARHVETVYAHMMGVHARAEQVDEGVRILHEFKARFPPSAIVDAASKQEITSGPGYLVQLSSFLYPETMDYSINNGRNTAEKAKDLMGGTRIRKALPKSEINNYNLFGLPPILSYQMVYSLFHRLKEEEDKRSEEVLSILREYKRALKKALEIREELEIKSKLGRGNEVDTARKEIIGLPHGKRGETNTLARSSTPSISEVLSEPERTQLASEALRGAKAKKEEIKVDENSLPGNAIHESRQV